MEKSDVRKENHPLYSYFEKLIREHHVGFAPVEMNAGGGKSYQMDRVIEDYTDPDRVHGSDCTVNDETPCSYRFMIMAPAKKILQQDLDDLTEHGFYEGRGNLIGKKTSREIIWIRSQVEAGNDFFAAENRRVFKRPKFKDQKQGKIFDQALDRYGKALDSIKRTMKYDPELESDDGKKRLRELSRARSHFNRVIKRMCMEKYAPAKAGIRSHNPDMSDEEIYDQIVDMIKRDPDYEFLKWYSPILYAENSAVILLTSSKGDYPVSNPVCISIVHQKDYYEHNHKDDPYLKRHSAPIVQHIALENLQDEKQKEERAIQREERKIREAAEKAAAEKAADETGTDKAQDAEDDNTDEMIKAAVKKIKEQRMPLVDKLLDECLIKHDIAEGHLTLADWEQDGTWYFIAGFYQTPADQNKNKKQAEFLLSCMELHADKSFRLVPMEKLIHESNEFGLSPEKFQEIMSRFCCTYDRETECAVISPSGHVYYIMEQRLRFLLPDTMTYQTIRNGLPVKPAKEISLRKTGTIILENGTEVNDPLDTLFGAVRNVNVWNSPDGHAVFYTAGDTTKPKTNYPSASNACRVRAIIMDDGKSPVDKDDPEIQAILQSLWMPLVRATLSPSVLPCQAKYCREYLKMSGEYNRVYRQTEK